MTTEKNFRRFLMISAAVVAGGVLASIAVVAVIDPYRLYGFGDVEGINRIKPLPTRYQNQIKLHGALAHDASSFILGNSRAELGLDPEHPGFGRAAYNLALAGTSLSTSRDQLEHLQDAGVKPVRLVIGVEFLDFLLDPSSPSPAPEPKTKNRLAALTWKADALFSMDSLLDSIKTLRLQRVRDPQSITARGFNPLLEYNKFARDDGYYPIFQQRATENAKRFVRIPRGLIDEGTGSSPDIEDLRAILLHGVREKADVHLMIYPYHAQILAMFEAAGLAAAFDEWKEILVREVAAIRAANPGARVTLWDFSGFSGYQCEAIPGKGDKTVQTRWYWEAGHFKPALGHIMLSRILASGNGQNLSSAFGFELTEATAASNRARIASERAACAADKPEIFAHARRLITTARVAVSR